MTRFVVPMRPLVLLVEDEPLVRETNLDILQEAGFRVIEAGDADAAFNLLQYRPDVQAVVTDVDMPGSINGFEFARLTAQGWPNAGIIVISGKTAPKHGDLPPGAVFLAKPYRPEVLVHLVRTQAESRTLDTASSPPVQSETARRKDQQAI